MEEACAGRGSRRRSGEEDKGDEMSRDLFRGFSDSNTEPASSPPSYTAHGRSRRRAREEEAVGKMEEAAKKQGCPDSNFWLLRELKKQYRYALLLEFKSAPAARVLYSM